VQKLNPQYKFAKRASFNGLAQLFRVESDDLRDKRCRAPKTTEAPFKPFNSFNRYAPFKSFEEIKI